MFVEDNQDPSHTQTSVLKLIFMAAIAALLLTTIFAWQSDTVYATDDPVQSAIGHRDDCRVRTKSLTTVESQFDVDTTAERLQSEMTERGLGIFAVIDHQANAESVDLELRPTTLILFGNPAVGTLLMQSEQSIGLDLPLKMLVWEDGCETVRIGYNDVEFLQKRHGIQDKDQVFDNVAAALAAISTEAAAE